MLEARPTAAVGVLAPVDRAGALLASSHNPAAEHHDIDELTLAVNECQRLMIDAERDPANAAWFQTLDMAGGFPFASRAEIEHLLATAPTPMLAGMAYAEFLSRVMNPRNQ